MVDLVFQACSNCTTLIQQIQYLDSLTDVGFGGVFGIVMLIAVAGILFLVQKAFAVEKAFAVSLFITAFLGILLAIMGLVSNNIIYIVLITLAIAVFMLLKRSDSGGF